MNKLITVLMCCTAVSLSAGSKQANQSEGEQQPQSQQIAANKFSTNNLADIKTDTQLIDQISTKNVAKASEFQNEMMKAMQSGQADKVKQTLTSMLPFIDSFNNELAQAQLKSVEVSSLRDKLIQMNNLSLKMVEQTTATPPNPVEVKQTQEEMATLQKQLLEQQKRIQQKLS